MGALLGRQGQEPPNLVAEREITLFPESVQFRLSRYAWFAQAIRSGIHGGLMLHPITRRRPAFLQVLARP